MTSGVAEEVAGGNVGRWSRLDGGAYVAMISIPMLLTRRGWLGWATPYFLSLFVRLASLHALRPRFPSSFWPHQIAFFLSQYFIQLFFQYSFRRILHSLRCSFLQRYPSSASMQNCSHQLLDGDQYRFFIDELQV